MNQALDESVAPSDRLKPKPPIIPSEQAIIVRTGDKDADLRLRNPKLPLKDFLLKPNRILRLIKRPLPNIILRFSLSAYSVYSVVKKMSSSFPSLPWCKKFHCRLSSLLPGLPVKFM